MLSCRRGAAWWQPVAGSFTIWVFGLRADWRDEVMMVSFEFDFGLISFGCRVCGYLGYFFSVIFLVLLFLIISYE